MNKVRSRAHNFIMLVTVILLAFSLMATALIAFPEKASALANIDDATKIGGGAELYDKETGEFNSDVMSDLVEKLFGEEDSVEYIKSMKDTATNSFVVPASTINAKVGNNNGLVVKLGGLEWMVASLTLDDRENVIATLFLSNPQGTSQYYSDVTNTKGNNAYSRSIIRNNVLLNKDNTTWNLFSQGGEGSFAEKYLVQPKYIKYQQTETMVGRQAYWYNCPNDALSAPSSGWHNDVASNPYKSTDTFGGHRYDEWGNDYIWLPSITETGATDIASTSSIWKLSTAQLLYSMTIPTVSYYTRSGRYDAFQSAYIIQRNNGKYSYTQVNATAGVRPAIHLNLSAIGLNFSLKNPEDVTTTYNGEKQTLSSIANAKAVSWYNKKWYEHTEEYIKVTYPDPNIINVGEYWAKVELQQKWFDDVKAEVEVEGDEQGLTPEEKEALYESKKPKFEGDPDTGDPEHIESDTVRWFKIIVEPKEVTLTKPSYNSTTGVLTPATFADESELYSDRPVIATKFTGTAANGTEFNQIDVVPNMRGTYKAKAIFVNSAEDKTEYKGNYVIKNASDMTCDVVINKSRLSIVGVAESSKPYTGQAQTFALSGYSSDWTQYAELTLPDGVTLKGSDEDGWNLSVTTAGSYDIIATIKSDKTTDWCWNTANFAEEIVTPRTFTITVNRKTLIVDFTSTSGGFLLQAGTDVKFGAEGNNIVDGDEVKLTLEYINSEDPSVRIPVTGGSLDASGLSPGTYYLIATLKDDVAADNKNYVLDGGEARQEFTVSAKNVVIDSVNWQYSQNNGVPTPIASGTGLSQSSPLIVTYNGSAYVFSINTTNLASIGVKVDASFGSNGYTNGSQTNATSSTVAITVRIMPLDDAYAFNDENGKPLAQQYKDFTLYVKVDKADIDFSNVKWSAEELEYTSVNQNVSIVSGLPSFLSASYNAGATGKDVGEYKAVVSSLTVTNESAAANYNIPTISEIQANEYLNHTWNIIKKRITVTWISGEQTGEDGTVIFVPALSDNSTGALVYTYYNADRTKEMTLDEIFADYDETTLKDYYVCVRLKESGGSYNATNCVLIESGHEVTESYQGFKAGEQKNPVRVSLVKSVTTYNKSAQPAEIEVEGGNLTVNDVTVTYKKEDGSPLSGIPTNAGTYKVVITLSNGLEGDYSIVGQCEFEYTIEKASYDISSLKWVDTENNNVEYTESYVWTYGVSHTLSLIGSEGIDGLTIGYSADTEANLTGENAGEYKVVVEFSVIDEENWNVPKNMEFTWNITPYTPDLSSVTWNYNTDSPFVFSIEGGKAKEYSVYLVGLPEGLSELIVYGGDTAKYSDAGSHATTFTVDEEHMNRGNFGELVFGSGLDTRLVWEIKSLTIDKPEQRQNKTFRTEGYSFEEITNLPSDWAQYFDVTVLDIMEDEVPSEGGTWTFKNVNQYRIQIKFKSGMNTANGGTNDNVKWSDNGRGAYQVTLKIETLFFDVNGWKDGSENMRATLDSDSVSEIEKYFDYVIYKTEGGSPVGDALAGNAILEYDTDYIISIKLKAEFKGNVKVRYSGEEVEETAPYAFKTEADPLTNPPEYFYRKPVGEELTVCYEFTGERIDFVFGDWFVSDKMQVISGDMFGTDFGSYTVRVGFKRGSLSAWEPEDAPRPDTSPVTITFVITKRMVTIPAEGSLEYSGSEQIFVPEGFDGTVITVVSGDKGTNVGEYTLTLALKDPVNTVWNDGSIEGSTENQTVTWNITPKKIDIPIGGGTFTYNGSEHTFVPDGFDSTYMDIVSGDKGTNAGEYSLVIALKDSANTVWDDGSDEGTTANQTVTWNITPKKIDIPTGGGTFTYNGSEQSYSPDGFDSAYMDIVSGDKGTNAGEYSLVIALKDTANTVWDDGSANGSTENKTLTWNITPKKIDIPTGGGTFTYNGSEQTFVPEDFDETYMNIVSGDKGTNAGEYSLVIALKDTANTVWDDGSANGSTENKTLTWNIAQRVLTRPTIKGKLTYTGAEIDLEKSLNDFVAAAMTITGDTKGRNAGEYTAVITLNDAVNNVWASEESAVALADGSIELTLVWTIAKAQILPSWKEGDIPSLDTPTEFFGLIEFEYTYYDEDGKTVTKSKLKDGAEYQVVAKIKAEYANNFEFVNAAGEVLPTPTASSPYTFEAVVENENNNENNNNSGTNQGTIVAGSSMPDYMWIIITVVICVVVFNGFLLILLVVAILIFVMRMAMKKNNEPQPPMPPYPYYYPPYYPNNDDDDEDDDDEDEEEDDDEGSDRESRSSSSGRESEEKADKEDDRRADEIAAATYENGKYVPDGATVIKDEQLVNRDEAKRLENDSSFYAFEKRDGESVMTVADGAIVINGSERLDIQEEIRLLSDDQKRYFFGLRDYAMEKSGGKPSFAKYHLTVGKGAKQVIKLSIKDGEVVAYFRIEDERLRNIRRNAKENDAEIKIKETEIQVDGEAAYEMAKDLVDLRQTQIEENFAYQKQLRKEKRKALRDAKKNSETADIGNEENSDESGIVEEPNDNNTSQDFDDDNVIESDKT